MKYGAVHGDIYSIFGSTNWLEENIKTYPSNFTGSANEYIRVSVITSGVNITNIPRSTAGLLMIDIYVQAGLGTKRVNEIADKLDDYLAGKLLKTTVAGNTQFGSSNLTPRGNDTANPGLYHASYSIPFNFFGV